MSAPVNLIVVLLSCSIGGFGVSGLIDNDRSNDGSIDECLQKDSISCLQIQLFRTARQFLDKPSIQVFGGAELVKNDLADSSRSFSGAEDIIEEQLSSTASVAEKAEVLESFVVEEARTFFEKRNIQWNVASLARNLISAAPEPIKKAAAGFMSESRGRKKVFKMLLPFLLGLKIKFGTTMGLVFLGIVMLAKKAMLLSFLSIAISGFMLIKKMMNIPHHEVYPQTYPGWQSHSDVGHVEYAAHSSPQAQEVAYGAQKPVV